MAKPIRIERLSSLIKRRVAEVIEFELADPRAKLVTITRVSLTRDLSYCKVYYSVLEPRPGLTQQMLDHARGHIQREVGKILHTRTTPQLQFIHDPSIAEAIRISQVIDRAIEQDRQRHVEVETHEGGESEGGEESSDGRSAPTETD